jgi:hypothetical protein
LACATKTRVPCRVNQGATHRLVRRAARSGQLGAVLSEDLSMLLSEPRITRAYMRLLLIAPDKDGSKTVSLARIGNYEVLMVEFAQFWLADFPPLWLELYAHDIDAAIDSCRCHDLEEMVGVAKLLILRAKAHNDECQATSDPDRH